MKHLYIKGKKQSTRTIILFHGTGGRETDLLNISATIDPNAAILSLRGNVDENGQTRFFKRLDPYTFDEESLRDSGEEIFNELKNLSQKYDIDLKESVMLGYSNGANMIAHLFLNYELECQRGILLHPAYRSENIKVNTLLDHKFLIIAGARDMTATAGEAYQLKAKFEQKGAHVDLKLTDGGHEISSQELMESHVWYLSTFK